MSTKLESLTQKDSPRPIVIWSELNYEVIETTICNSNEDQFLNFRNYLFQDLSFITNAPELLDGEQFTHNQQANSFAFSNIQHINHFTSFNQKSNYVNNQPPIEELREKKSNNLGEKNPDKGKKQKKIIRLHEDIYDDHSLVHFLRIKALYFSGFLLTIFSVALLFLTEKNSVISEQSDNNLLRENYQRNLLNEQLINLDIHNLATIPIDTSKPNLPSENKLETSPNLPLATKPETSIVPLISFEDLPPLPSLTSIDSQMIDHYYRNPENSPLTAENNNNSETRPPRVIIERYYYPENNPPIPLTIPTPEQKLVPPPPPENPPTREMIAPPLNQPAPPQSTIEEQSTVVYTLQGLMNFGENAGALFRTGELLLVIKVGENVSDQGWNLEKIDNDQAVLRKNEEIRSLKVGESLTLNWQ